MPITLSVDALSQCCEFPLNSIGRYVNACLVCLGSAGHSSGVNFPVDGVVDDSPWALAWDESVDVAMQRAHADVVQAVADGAIALAWLAVKEAHGHIVVSESCRGEGYDYHLSDTTNKDGGFLSGPRLEVSGIFRENGSNTVVTRVNSKRKRLKPGCLPTYIFVAEFASPKGTLEYVP